MQLKTSGIILKNTRIGDKKIISKIYTQNRGLQTFAIQVGTTPQSKIKPAHVQALNLVELDVMLKENQEIGRVQEIRVFHPFREINFNVMKNCISSFINEALLKSLRETEANPTMFEFVKNSLVELDEHPKNFGAWHLYFLMNLSRLIGFFPHDNFSKNHPFFNLLDGVFESLPPKHANYFDREDSLYFHQLIREYELYKNTPPVYEVRNRQLHLLIQYFRCHIPGFTDFKTLPVLQATLHD